MQGSQVLFLLLRFPPRPKHERGPPVVKTLARNHSACRSRSGAVRPFYCTASVPESRRKCNRSGPSVTQVLHRLRRGPFRRPSALPRGKGRSPRGQPRRLPSLHREYTRNPEKSKSFRPDVTKLSQRAGSSACHIYGRNGGRAPGRSRCPSAFGYPPHFIPYPSNNAPAARISAFFREGVTIFFLKKPFSVLTGLIYLAIFISFPLRQPGICRALSDAKNSLSKEATQ